MLGAAPFVSPSAHSTVTRPRNPAFWIVASVYFVIYIALNTVTDTHQYLNSGITLWSPDNGVSLMLIMWSPLFAPVVIISEIISDIYIHHVNNGIFTIISIYTFLSLVYFLVSILLRDVFKVKIDEIKYESILSLIVLLPATAAFAMILYCGVLYLSGALSKQLFSAAALNFWLGDTVGMVVTIPATIAIYDICNNTRWKSSIKGRDFLLFIGLTIVSFASAFVSASRFENHYLFYLLFLPVIWMSIRYGYVGSALSLLVTQLFVFVALTYFQVDDKQFGVFQTLMLILSATGLLLGVAITEREQTERLLRDQRAELARVGAQAAAGAMASTVAHEISQPLSAMTVYIHSACLNLDGGVTVEAVANARAALAEAELQGNKTRAIIERIRDFVAGGKLRLEPIDLVQLIEKIRRISEEEAEDRGVAVSVEAPMPATMLRGDRIAIEQALNNLVTNAIDSAAGRGDSLGRVVLRLTKRDRIAVIAVDDNGAGVASEVSDTLFETFETTKAHGMGLGLPLALQVARRHSGRLTWRPLNPRGASFTIELPIDGPD